REIRSHARFFKNMPGGTDVAGRCAGVILAIHGLVRHPPKGRSSVVIGKEVKQSALVALLFLGALPFPFFVCALAAYLATRGMLAGAPTRQLLLSQLLLVLTVLLVASAGAFVMWRTGWAGAMDVEAEAATRDEVLGEGGDLASALMDSVSRMLVTIE